MSGGAGYIMSRASLEALMSEFPELAGGGRAAALRGSPRRDFFESSLAEDVALGLCMAASGARYPLARLNVPPPYLYSSILALSRTRIRWVW